MRILPQSDTVGALARVWRSITRRLEQDCLLCAAPSRHAILCAPCAADLPRLRKPFCRRCARPLAAGAAGASGGERSASPGAADGNALCGRCLHKPPHYDTTLAAFHYDFPLDQMVHSFKYGQRLALATFFGQQLAALGDRGLADRIVPLPLHRERLRERGFNQALELARPVSQEWHIPIDAHSCRRTRNTAAQTGLGLRERLKNIRGAFACSTDLSGQRIILVDDVMTSGASLNECARTLKLHGAAEIIVLVVARALPKS